MDDGGSGSIVTVSGAITPSDATIHAKTIALSSLHTSGSVMMGSDAHVNSGAVMSVEGRIQASNANIIVETGGTMRVLGSNRRLSCICACSTTKKDPNLNSGGYYCMQLNGIRSRALMLLALES